MADGRESETIELEIKDFGPIVEAKLDLRPFTVFVGPSNTGKSYLAILIYALHRFFGGGGGAGDHSRLIFYELSTDRRVRQLSKEEIRTFTDWAARTFKDVRESSEVTHFTPPRQIIDAVQSEFGNRADQLVEEIHRCFGTTEQVSLIRNGVSAGAHIWLRECKSSGATRSECLLTIGSKSAILETLISNDVKIDGKYIKESSFDMIVSVAMIMPEQYRILEKTHQKNMEFLWSSTAHNVKALMSTQIINSHRAPIYYLPADRTGVMHAHAAIVSAMIQSASRAGLRHTGPAPALSGVLSDFLDRLIRIDQPSFSAQRQRRDMGAGIEDGILDGAVRTEHGAITGYPSFFYRPRGWKRDLPLMNASSMVSELAPVVLFLRHAVEPGNLLIVEEPESHLHPAKQVEFTRQLAQLVQAGVRVLITTHSEWILEELANIVQRSGLSEDDRKALPNGEVALRPDQVGAWLFEPKKRPKGSVVKEIPLDKDGTYPTGFDDVALALHNDWAAIGNRIEDAQ